jgi:hypothetical protein
VTRRGSPIYRRIPVRIENNEVDTVKNGFCGSWACAILDLRKNKSVGVGKCLVSSGGVLRNLT